MALQNPETGQMMKHESAGMENGKSPDIRIEYKLVGTGWAECTLNIHGQTCTVTASYLSHALDAFLRAVNKICLGGTQARFFFDEEPGEYRWLLSREPDGGLRIKILAFQNLWNDMEDAEGELIFEAVCALSEFSVALAKAISDLLSEYGIEGYADEWAIGDFPLAQYLNLCDYAGVPPVDHSLHVMAAKSDNVIAQYRLAMHLKASDKPRKAVHWYRKATMGNHAESTYQLGLAYLNGEGVKKNHGKARHWLRRAAQLGHTDADVDLGFHYAESERPQDIVKAHRHLQRAFAAGKAMAGRKLALLQVAKSDHAEGLQTLLAAARMGDSLAIMAECILSLATILSSPADIPVVASHEEVSDWFNKGEWIFGADMHHFYWYLSCMHKTLFNPNGPDWEAGLAAIEPLSHNQSAQGRLFYAHIRLIVWTDDAADFETYLGLADCALQMRMECLFEKERLFEDMLGDAYLVAGRLYEQGVGTDRHAQKALSHYARAAKIGCVVSAYLLHALLSKEFGYCAENQPKEAAYRLLEEAKNDALLVPMWRLSDSLQWGIGLLYLDGIGVERNPALAAAWLACAAKTNAIARRELAQLRETLTEAEREESAHWLAWLHELPFDGDPFTVTTSAEMPVKKRVAKNNP